MFNHKKNKKPTKSSLFQSDEESEVGIRLISPFALAASPGVLVILDVITGLELSDFANAEAVLGFLSDLKLEGGVLRMGNGAPIEPGTCRGFLARLGAVMGEPLALNDCLAICRKMDLPVQRTHGMVANIRQYIGGAKSEFNHYIGMLEERGYRLRQSFRLSTLCHAIPDDVAASIASPRRLFAVPTIPMDLAVAA